MTANGRSHPINLAFQVPALSSDARGRPIQIASIHWLLWMSAGVALESSLDEITKAIGFFDLSFCL